uniref:Putative secreted protein n=1 Tax=Anopheles triannulatus TaxID=58253 RepID=A0A2M4B6D4_9DIPT
MVTPASIAICCYSLASGAPRPDRSIPTSIGSFASTSTFVNGTVRSKRVSSTFWSPIAYTTPRLATAKGCRHSPDCC